MIRGIRDADRLEGYRLAETRYFDPPRSVILSALDARERELTDAPIATDTTPGPVAATDGGENIQTESATREEIDEWDDNHDEPHPVFDVPHKPVRVPVKGDSDEPDAADDGGDTLHPDTKGLEAGQVLTVDLPSAEEYVFPATADADAPFLLVGTDDAGRYQDTLTLGEAAGKLSGSADPKPIAEIDIEPPANAATNGGESQ